MVCYVTHTVNSLRKAHIEPKRHYQCAFYLKLYTSSYLLKNYLDQPCLNITWESKSGPVNINGVNVYTVTYVSFLREEPKEEREA